MKNGIYPKSLCPSRPFHVWDEQKQKRVPYRYFTHVQHACDRAMCAVKRWGKTGETLTVYDTRDGQMVEQYTRKIATLAITTNPHWKGKA